MTKFNFAEVEDAKEGGGMTFDPIPDGQYKAFIEKSEEKQGSKGPYLNIEWHIMDGEFAGNKVWDNVSFSDGALPRLKLILSRLGLEVTGVVDVTPELLHHQQAWITVYTDSYRNKAGDEAQTNRIKYDGFNLIGESARDIPDDDDLPVI